MSVLIRMVCGLLLAAWSTAALAETVDKKDLKRIQSRVWTETFIAEHYFPDGIDDVDVVGVQFDRFVNSNLFVGGVAYGAVTGGRGGYALGALHAGFARRFGSRFSVEVRGLFGGAGGGGVNAGGGLIVEPTTALIFHLTPAIAIKVGGGYLKFLTSGEGFAVANAGISFSSRHLFIPLRDEDGL
ncbi:MAG: hypothetical protein R8K46_03425 [Mariprofundaceae bacterium]